jgi:dolichol-phosphate mannosyltransferase
MQDDSPGNRLGLVSIVVPTYREADNLPDLIVTVSGTMRAAGLPHEILIVDDDSRDGTEECVARLRDEGHPVRVIVRRGERGLSSAVIQGLREARGKILVCMDADLSHPPEKIPELVEGLRKGADFAIGSRYVAGGSTDRNWGFFRRLNSKVATLLARPLTRAKDPMAGFFALYRKTFEGSAPLSPVGCKIGLELMIKCNCRRVREVPIHFRARKRGRSKTVLRERVNYVRHLMRLLGFKL